MNTIGALKVVDSSLYRYNQALRLLLGASSPQDLKKAASPSATPR
jgi:hypothetical protein